MRLLEAAGRLFAKGSYEEVSVAEILEESGLKAPSLYHHFRDKEGLYVAWACWVLEGLKEPVEAANDLQALVKILCAPHNPDMLQIIRDVRLLTRSHSRDAILSRLETDLLAPTSGILKQAGYGRANKAGALSFIHAASAAHPLYQKTTKIVVAPDDIASLFRAHSS